MEKIHLKNRPWLFVFSLSFTFIISSHYGLSMVHAEGTINAIMAGDARLIAAQQGEQIWVWERATGNRLAHFTNSSSFRGSLSSRQLVMVNDNSIVIKQGPSFNISQTIKLPQLLTVHRTAISTDGRLVAFSYPKGRAAGDPDTIDIYQVANTTRRMTLHLAGGRILGFTFSQDSTWLAMFGDYPAKSRALLKVYRLTPMASSKKSPAWIDWSSTKDQTTYAAAFSADGHRLVLGAGNRLLLWDIPKRTLIGQTDTVKATVLFPAAIQAAKIPVGGAHQIAFAPDGKRFSTLHGVGIVGVAIWQIQDSPSAKSSVTRTTIRPTEWIKRPSTSSGILRQIAWDTKGELHLITTPSLSEVVVYKLMHRRFSGEQRLMLRK